MLYSKPENQDNTTLNLLQQINQSFPCSKQSQYQELHNRGPHVSLHHAREHYQSRHGVSTPRPS